MTEANAATEAAPYSPEEMRSILNESLSEKRWITTSEEARFISTAVCLDRAINWILARERDAGKGVIPALLTVRDALCATDEPTATIGGGK